jgi:hypothetical protein
MPWRREEISALVGNRTPARSLVTILTELPPPVKSVILMVGKFTLVLKHNVLKAFEAFYTH